ncbi:hypothetical protein BGZ92_004958 [Podila epicladia]|nr:hypothetical protein BGZ92_004958 [Podila epicladia]
MPVTHPHSLSSTVSSPKFAFAAEMATAPVNIPASSHKKRSSGSDILGSPTSSMKRSISTPTMASASMVSTEQVAEFERHRQGQAMMTTYISSAIREKKQQG